MDGTRNAALAVSLAATAIFRVAAHAAAGGELDPTFGGDGMVTTDFGDAHNEASGVAIQDDGRIVVVGMRGFPFIADDFRIARYNNDGSLDASFGTAGKVTTSFGEVDGATSVAIQGDGKIVVAGSGDGHFALARYDDEDGSLDPTFGSGGKTTTDFGGEGDGILAIAVQTDGKIVAVGFTSSFDEEFGSRTDIAVARYQSNGALDPTFDGDGMLVTVLPALHNYASVVAVDGDDRIVVGGRSGSDPRNFALLRYESGGALDSTFDGDGLVSTRMKVNGDEEIQSLVIQDDGKIVVAGDTDFSGIAVARFNDTGTLDTTFSDDGIVLVEFADNPIALALQPDGKIVYAARSLIDTFLVGRLNSDGSHEAGFVPEPTEFFGFRNYPRAVAVQDDGHIVAAGLAYGDMNQTTSYFAVARFLGLDCSHCVDDNPCTIDTCNLDMECVHTGDPMGDCDDGNPCTIDACDVGFECANLAEPLPADQCIDGTRVDFQLKAGSNPKLKWKWSAGPEFTSFDLGWPLDTTTYALCIYDTTASVPSLASSLLIEPSDSWTYRGQSGWTYSDRSALMDGVQSIKLSPAATRTTAQLKAGGVNLAAPVPFDAASYFDQDPVLTIQLISSGGLCLGGQFADEDTLANTATKFKGKAQ